jgi:ribonuclease-3
MNPSEIDALEEKIGYRFKDRGILLEALTHKSLHYENPREAPTHNERLEFLGDSVLALVVVENLYNLKFHHPESEMSKIKSFVVKGIALSAIAMEISLGDYLRLGKGEEDTGGRKKVSILANALEALIGAVHIDGGIESARQCVDRLLGDRLVAAVESGQYHDYKTELQEECQMRFGMLPEYRMTEQMGLEHEKTFKMEVFISGKPYGSGAGRSKKEAQIAAAKEAMKRLKMS